MGCGDGLKLRYNAELEYSAISAASAQTAEFITRRFKSALSILESEETGTVRRREDDLILQVREIEDRQVRHVRPIGCGQIRTLLQPEIHGGNEP